MNLLMPFDNGYERNWWQKNFELNENRIIGRCVIKLFFRISFKIFLILTILSGSASGEEIKETDPVALFNQGETFFHEGQYDQAIAYFNKTIEINPRYADAYHNRGVAYFSKREYEKAWDDVHKTESLGSRVNPEFLQALREASGRQK